MSDLTSSDEMSLTRSDLRARDQMFSFPRTRWPELEPGWLILPCSKIPVWVILRTTEPRNLSETVPEYTLTGKTINDFGFQYRNARWTNCAVVKLPLSVQFAISLGEFTLDTSNNDTLAPVVRPSGVASRPTPRIRPGSVHELLEV